MNIKKQFEVIKEERAIMVGKLQQVNGTYQALKKTIDDRVANVDVLNSVTDLLQKYSSLKEDEIKTKIDKVITKGLKAIFPDESFESQIDFEIKRGQAVAEPKLVTGEMKTDIVDADSGGVANVVGFLYQLLILAQRKPRQRQIIIADEPFKNLSKEYLEPTGAFIRMLSERLGIQIVLITHQDELKDIGDKVYRFSKVNERTLVELETGG